MAVSCSGREWPQFPRAVWEQSVSARPGQGTAPNPTEEALVTRPMRVGARCRGRSAWGRPRAGLARDLGEAAGGGTLRRLLGREVSAPCVTFPAAEHSPRRRREAQG